MPAEAIHLTALAEALRSPRAATARALVEAQPEAARLGAVLVDLPYLDAFFLEAARYALGRPPRASVWGARLHEAGPVDVLLALLRRARGLGQGRHPDGGVLAAVALGLASHAAIDRALHPLINALARARLVEKHIEWTPNAHANAHRDVEKFQSVCFHEQHLGHDFMGSREVTSYIGVRAPLRLGRAPRAVAEQIDGALGDAFGEPPGVRVLDGWAANYRRYAWLLGSPVGGYLVSETDKAFARPRYLTGAWGTFAEALAQAIARSVPVVAAAAEVYRAEAADHPAAEAALLVRLPRGTINPAGRDVDLTRPYVVTTVAAAPDAATAPGATTAAAAP